MRKFILNLACFFLASFVGLSAQQKAKLIKVGTDDQEMIFKVDDNGKAIFAHWGQKLNDPSPLLDKKYKIYKNVDADGGDDISPMLYNGYGDGGGSFLEPALQVVHTDGVLTTELAYQSSEVKKIDNNVTETIIKLKDKLYPFFVDIKFTAYQKENIITESVTVYHNEPSFVKLNKVASSYMTFHADNYYLSHFNGGWAHEFDMHEDKMTPGIFRIQSKKGMRATLGDNPSFMLSLNDPANEDSGEIYAGSLAWSGNFDLSFEYEEGKIVHMTAGINPFASAINLAPGEKFTTPEMILTYSNKGRNDITHHFHDWARNYNMSHGDELRPIVLNSWEGSRFSFNEKIITDMIDDAAKFGIEMFVLDDGWFGDKYPRDNERNGLGDWVVNKKKLPRGIDYLAQYAKKKGVKFGIWIEPEMANVKSEVVDNHPEWIIQSGDRPKTEVRWQYALDLANPDVQDYVFESFDNLMALSKDIDYVKWDCNRYVTNVGSTYLSADNQTHFWVDYVEGLYKVYDRVRTKYPDVMIQLCSSGGGRMDFGALKYHDEFWPSDNTSPWSRLFIQYGTNMFFPAIGTGAHVSANPNHQTNVVTPLKFRFDVAMMGRLGMELQPNQLNKEEYEFATQGIANYKRIRPTVQFGDLYRIGSPYSDSGWSSAMYVSKDKKEAAFFAFCMKYEGVTPYFEAKMKGLDPNKKYKIEELNIDKNQEPFWGNGKVFTGDFLMKSGITLDISRPFESAVLYLTEM